MFLLTLAGQALAGHAQLGADRMAAGLPGSSLGRYLTSASFAADVAENWQSEYLQFFLYVFATVWLIQRGSPESKKADEIGRGSNKDQQVGEHASAASPRWARSAAGVPRSSPGHSAW